MNGGARDIADTKLIRYVNTIVSTKGINNNPLKYGIE